MRPVDEPSAVVERYARRAVGDRYSHLQPDVWQTLQERQRAMLDLFSRRLHWTELASRRLVEVGCGNGGNLLEMMRLGFVPEHLTGLELLPERALRARHVLPQAVDVQAGDALRAPIAPASQDIVYQSVVFSSLLDDGFQQRLADTMWNWLRPGGGVLWYDFIYDNPRNHDVRGVPMARIRTLFPEGRILAQRLTLAPPLARRVCRWHPALYTLLNALPPLRTHLLCWIEKP